MVAPLDELPRGGVVLVVADDGQVAHEHRYQDDCQGGERREKYRSTFQLVYLPSAITTLFASKYDYPI